MASVPGAVVYHWHDDTLKGLFKMCVRHGIGMSWQKQLGVEGVYPDPHDLKDLMIKMKEEIMHQIREETGSVKKKIAYSCFDILRQFGIFYGYHRAERKMRIAN